MYSAPETRHGYKSVPISIYLQLPGAVFIIRHNKCRCSRLVKNVMKMCCIKQSDALALSVKRYKFRFPVMSTETSSTVLLISMGFRLAMSPCSKYPLLRSDLSVCASFHKMALKQVVFLILSDSGNFSDKECVVQRGTHTCRGRSSFVGIAFRKCESEEIGNRSLPLLVKLK
jgi:hypothetical protein